MQPCRVWKQILFWNSNYFPNTRDLPGESAWPGQYFSLFSQIFVWLILHGPGYRPSMIHKVLAACMLPQLFPEIFSKGGVYWEIPRKYRNIFLLLWNIIGKIFNKFSGKVVKILASFRKFKRGHLKLVSGVGFKTGEWGRGGGGAEWLAGVQGKAPCLHQVKSWSICERSWISRIGIKWAWHPSIPLNLKAKSSSQNEPLYSFYPDRINILNLIFGLIKFKMIPQIIDTN
jgi:hypothetical protein